MTNGDHLRAGGDFGERRHPLAEQLTDSQTRASSRVFISGLTGQGGVSLDDYLAQKLGVRESERSINEPLIAQSSLDSGRA